MNYLQVDELEAAVRSAKAADHSLEVQAAESRVRSLQGSLSRKEDTLRELRERMDQACGYNYSCASHTTVMLSSMCQ